MYHKKVPRSTQLSLVGYLLKQAPELEIQKNDARIGFAHLVLEKYLKYMDEPFVKTAD